MPERMDLVVVGSGSAATTAAFDCRAAGWSVAVVDSLPFGGTCALRGCDPKKVLVGAAELVDWNRRMAGRGAGDPKAVIDWPALVAFKRTFTDSFPEHLERSIVEYGIEAIHGRAAFVAPDVLAVGDRKIEASHFLIAAGSHPAPLAIPGEEHVTTSDRFLDLPALPKRVLFIGGGYISVEFAGVAARAGAKVTILHRGPSLLKGFDPDLAAQVLAGCREAGMEVILNSGVVGLEKRGRELVVEAKAGSERRSLSADLVVHGSGRLPDLADLDLTAAGVAADGRGVLVNEYLQSTTNPKVYAAGDAAHTAGLPLTPVAVAEGGAAAYNLVNGNSRRVDYSAIPTVCFNVPPVASVGLSQAAAEASGRKIRVNQAETSGWYSSRRTNEGRAGFKVIIDDESGRILGAHLLGGHAEEVINLFALAIQAGLTAADLKERLYSYPTRSSDLRYML
jgi:glutathione reductase (NADPH)